MPERTPLVSVVIATYGRPERVLRAIASVKRQTYSNVEIIVVDDSAEYNDAVGNIDAVRYVYDGDPQGLSHARNRGIEFANGEYLAFIDDDDQWAEKKLERQVASLVKHGGGLSTCWRHMASEDGHVQTVAKTDIDGDVVKKLLCRNVVGPPSGVVVSRDVVETVGDFDESFQLWEDREWYLRVALEYDVHCVEEPLVWYAIDSPGKMSGNFELVKDDIYPRFFSKYDALVERYGWRFIRGWQLRKFGKMSHDAGKRPLAAYYTVRAIVAYPFEWPFYRLLLRVSVGEQIYGRLDVAKDAAMGLVRQGIERWTDPVEQSDD